MSKSLGSPITHRNVFFHLLFVITLFFKYVIFIQGEPVNKSDELPKVENEQPIETEPAIAELVVKHPLENKWTLWFYEQKSKVWEENIHEVASFDTVEDFWW